jgi:hypothetical protein
LESELCNIENVSRFIGIFLMNLPLNCFELSLTFYRLLLSLHLKENENEKNLL